MTPSGTIKAKFYIHMHVCVCSFLKLNNIVLNNKFLKAKNEFKKCKMYNINLQIKLMLL